MADLDGEIIGYAVLGVASGQALAVDSAVHRDHRGRGVAFQLHDARMKRARARGFDWLIGATWEGNTHMKRLLDSLGFLYTITVPNYYPQNEPPADALMYVRDLRTL